MRQRRSRRRLVLWAGGLAALGVLAGCGPENGQNSLRPDGPVAEKIDNLFVAVVVVAIIVGILVCAGVVYAAMRFRARPGNESPKQTHGNTALEIGWTLLPAVLLAVIAVPTVSLIFDLDKEPKPNAVEITAVGKQWWWQFNYRAQDGASKLVTANEMVIPTGRDIHVNLEACDPSLPGECNVIHSFWVPELSGKRDVVPGRTNDLVFQAEKPGVFLGQCAEYCGLSHANMRFRVIAMTPGDYADWRAEQEEDPAVTLEDAGEAGELFSQTFGCTNCHTTEDSRLSTYGPNLTHLASRKTFASGYYPLTRKHLVEWILDAPSMVPMEAEDCRLGLGVPGVKCVGMPSFVKDTPQGQPTMTRQQAEDIADYLLELT